MHTQGPFHPFFCSFRSVSPSLTFILCKPPLSQGSSQRPQSLCLLHGPETFHHEEPPGPCHSGVCCLQVSHLWGFSSLNPLPSSCSPVVLILCRNKQLYETMLRETCIPITRIRYRFFSSTSLALASVVMSVCRMWACNVCDAVSILNLLTWERLSAKLRLVWLKEGWWVGPLSRRCLMGGPQSQTL